MCELMGMSFAEPISADFSIREFAHRGEENADGWGLAWYPDQSLAVIKEPVKWRSSQHSGFLESYHHLQSRIYIAHVRHKTTGAAVHADTHPFARELGGREYCFAHNGTILDAGRDLPLGRYRPVGNTDSEHVFCHLMEELAQRQEPLEEASGWKWLREKLVSLNRGGRMNCLLCDGRRLFCYHDANGWKGLAFRQVLLDNHKIRHFRDETLTVDLESTPANHGFVAATRPLSQKGWHACQSGELLVLEKGALLFSNQRDSM